MALLTVGHGRSDRQQLGDLLAGAGVDVVVDVRRYPGSRAHPDVSREALERWLPQRAIAYRWEERLGGRRRLPTGEPGRDTWWQVPQFRAYAAHTRSPEFAAALDEVLDESATRTVAVMCSESVWWRCHRRLVADVSVLARGTGVRHLMPDGRVSPHRPAAGARVRADGSIIWDGDAEAGGGVQLSARRGF
jgi:uncharacterized protein (DUF488 family)